MTQFGNSLNQVVIMKLDRTNFLVRKAWFFRGCSLDGHLLGTTASLPEFLDESNIPM
ncbi:hypothetical protein Syun_001386 [Stephania yunnanensis]|uniref:Uncharacterized protein n=1 Tax=Stephania yunnanensis TaxID=152371 RepID=A0AAP0LE01_9MAGN